MNSFNNGFYGEKTHFKMYKKGRQWLVAGVTVISLGLGVLGLNTVTASAVTAETPVAAAPATEKTTVSAADSTSNTSTEQPAAETENTAEAAAKTTEPETTNLGDATAEQVAAAKTKATAAYEDTGKAQTLTAVAPESTQETTINFNSTVIILILQLKPMAMLDKFYQIKTPATYTM